MKLVKQSVSISMKNEITIMNTFFQETVNVVEKAEMLKEKLNWLHNFW